MSKLYTYEQCRAALKTFEGCVNSNPLWSVIYGSLTDRGRKEANAIRDDLISRGYEAVIRYFAEEEVEIDIGGALEAIQIRCLSEALKQLDAGGLPQKNKRRKCINYALPPLES